MKIYLVQLLFVIIFSSPYLCGQNLLSGPECVVFDSLNNRYLVSNWNNGNIIAIDSAGNQTYFKQRSGHALGNCITGNAFYVSIGPAILGLKLDDPNDTIMYLPIPGTTQMDGMTVDDNNNLYVVASTQARLYKINLTSQTYSVLVQSGISSRPQDVIYDKRYNRLLICSWYNSSPIQAVYLEDSSLVKLVNTPIGNCDGLALDENGNYYFSSWATNSIYFYDSTFTNPPVQLSSGHSGPSNICYNKRDKLIAVPCFNSGKLDLIPAKPTSVYGNKLFPSQFKLNQNFPNPFNPETIVEYLIPKESTVEISVYTILGEKIENLVNETKLPGNYRAHWNGKNFASGVYLIKMSAVDLKGIGIYSETIKVILEK